MKNLEATSLRVRDNQNALLAAEARLRASRPTAVNLMICLDRMKAIIESGGTVENLVATAENIFDEDVLLCQTMSEHGAGLVEEGDSILTHCNTGGLATAGVGTALGVIRIAHEQR